MFNWSYQSSAGKNAPFRSHRLPNEKPSARAGKLPGKNLVKNGPEAPTTGQTIAFILSYQSKFHGKCVLLKIPYTLVT